MEKIVGIVGLGIMGGAIALNLIDRGWTVFGYDVDQARCSEFAAAGGHAVKDLGGLAQNAPVIMTSLPNQKALIAVAEGLAAAEAPSRIIVEMSTMTLDDKFAFRRPLEAAGHIVLDCPLSGTGSQAKRRDLVVYASGNSTAIAGLAPLFADFSKQNADLGAYGNGSKLKFVANHLVAINNVASAEAMVLAMKAGLDPQQVVDLVSAGAGQSVVFDLRAPMMVADVYEPATMRISTWQKDMAVIADFARGLGVKTPVFSATAPIYDEAYRSGLGDQDTGSVCRVLEGMADLKRKGTA